MAWYKFVLACCLLVAAMETLASARHIDGDYILGVGQQYNDSTLQLIGKVFRNFEANLTRLAQDTRAERFLRQMCAASECDKWTDWPDCPAVKGHWGWVVRTRECGVNTSHCTYEPEQARTEEERKICMGGQTGSDEEEETDDEIVDELDVKYDEIEEDFDRDDVDSDDVSEDNDDDGGMPGGNAPPFTGNGTMPTGNAPPFAGNGTAPGNAAGNAAAAGGGFADNDDDGGFPGQGHPHRGNVTIHGR